MAKVRLEEDYLVYLEGRIAENSVSVLGSRGRMNRVRVEGTSFAVLGFQIRPLLFVSREGDPI